MNIPLVRTIRGRIHQESCGIAPTHAKRWQWADGRPLEEIAAAGEKYGLKFCQRCLKGVLR